MNKLLQCAVFAVLTLSATAAFGHAEEPIGTRLFLNESGWLLQANFGVVDSEDPGRIVCEEAFLGGDGWLLAVLGPTEWVTFGESTIQRTSDGCAFEKVASLPDDTPTSADAHPESGNVAYVINAATDSGLWVSGDRGSTFEPVGGMEPDMHQMTGVRFIDPDTVIVSGYALGEMGAPKVWSVDVPSKTATELVPPDGVTYPYLHAAKGGHVLMHARRDAQVLFWGTPDDLGMVEREIAVWPTGADLSEDGQKAFVSVADESNRGVLIGTLVGAEATWETVADDLSANCVAHRDGKTYVCALNRLFEYDLFELDEAGERTGVLTFADFVGARECPDRTAVGDVCGIVWGEISSYFGEQPDAGGVNSEADMGPARDDDGTGDEVLVDGGDRPGGCCSTANGKRRGGEAWLLPLIIVGLFWTRRLRVRGAA